MTAKQVLFRSMEQALSRFARWLMVIRAQRPALLPSYPLLFLTAALVSLLGAVLVHRIKTVA